MKARAALATACALLALGLVTSVGAAPTQIREATATDPSGDSGQAADVAAVTARIDANDVLTVETRVTNRNDELLPGESLFVLVDADASDATGSSGWDFRVEYQENQPTVLQQWNGSVFAALTGGASVGHIASPFNIFSMFLGLSVLKTLGAGFFGGNFEIGVMTAYAGSTDLVTAMIMRLLAAPPPVDTTAPVVTVVGGAMKYNAKAKAFPLRYSVKDASKTREGAALYFGKTLIARYTFGLRTPGARLLVWKTTATQIRVGGKTFRLSEAIFRFCAQASDERGNRSPVVCKNVSFTR